MSCKSKWKKFTKNEKILLGIFIFFIIVITLMIKSLRTNPSAPTNTEPQQKICMTEKCVRSASTILKTIDQSVDPCDDFYKFACGGFLKNTHIPDEKTVVNKFSLLRNQVKLQLKTLLEQPVRSNDSHSVHLVKTVYNTCMDVTKIENESLGFFKKMFKELGGWPVIDNNFNDKKFDWKQLFYRLRRSGWNHDIFVRLYIEPDAKNSSKRILTIYQPYNFADQALKKGFSDNDTQAYFDYMITITTLFGGHELSTIVEMREVLDFEIKLAQILVSTGARINLTSLYNPISIKNLQKNIPSIPWLQLINNYLAPVEMLNSRDIVNVAFPKFLKNLEDLLLNTKKRTIANYMFWYILRNSVTNLPEKFRNQQVEYFKKTRNIIRGEPRWVQCLHELDKLNVATSSLYVKNFFKEDKKIVTEMASLIKGAFLENLRNLDWMDSETKERVLLKTKKINFFIGYPEDLLSEETVEEQYKELGLNPKGDFLEMKLHLSSFLHKKRVKKLKEVVLKSEWTSQALSYEVNGFYDQKFNTIEITAALLTHGLFFDAERPNYLNFGSVGEVIGHEIIHAFDELGIQFDENCNLDDWWLPTTLEIFKRKTECLVRQYGGLILTETGKKVNGNNTLNENIADNGGFKIAYQGYLKWIEKRHKEEAMLPGLPYTPRQLFWISAASDGCAKYRKEALNRFLVSGKHSPEFSRIVVPFINSEFFAKDFNCLVGSKMNPENKCQVW